MRPQETWKTRWNRLRLRATFHGKARDELRREMEKIVEGATKSGWDGEVNLRAPLRLVYPISKNEAAKVHPYYWNNPADLHSLWQTAKTLEDLNPVALMFALADQEPDPPQKQGPVSEVPHLKKHAIEWAIQWSYIVHATVGEESEVLLDDAWGGAKVVLKYAARDGWGEHQAALPPVARENPVMLLEAMRTMEALGGSAAQCWELLHDFAKGSAAAPETAVIPEEFWSNSCND